jgi:hypothetical protein
MRATNGNHAAAGGLLLNKPFGISAGMKYRIDHHNIAFDLENYQVRKIMYGGEPEPLVKLLLIVSERNR